MDNPARSFISKIGGYDAVALSLSKAPQTVHSAMQSGVLPAAWYDALCTLAKAGGVEAPPRSLFSFLQLTTASNADCGSGCGFNSGDRLHERAS